MRPNFFHAGARRACAFIRVGATRHGRWLPQLDAEFHRTRVAGAAHPQCRWRAAAKFRVWKGRFGSRKARRPTSSITPNASGETAFGEVYGVLVVSQWNGYDEIDMGTRPEKIRPYFARPICAAQFPAWKALTPALSSDLRGAIVFFGVSAVTLSTSSRRRCRPRCPASKPMRKSSTISLSGVTLRTLGSGPSPAGCALALLRAALVATTWGFGPAIRGARIRRRGLRDRRGQLVRDRAAGLPRSIPPIPGVLGRPRLFHRRRDALCGEAPPGARNSPQPSAGSSRPRLWRVWRRCPRRSSSAACSGS